MVNQDPNGYDDRGGEEEAGPGLEGMREMAVFALGAPRRHPKLAAAVFIVIAALGLTIAKTMPRTYNASAKLLAQRSALLRAITSPNRAVGEAENPTKNAAELIVRHENLVALVSQAHLVERFYSTRAPALKLKDQIATWMGGGRMSEEDKMKALVATLEKKLSVTVDDTSVQISVDWDDAQTAYDIVTLVEKNFLEARYDGDMAVIQDSIDVLQEHAKTELAKVDSALGDYQKVYAERVAKVGPTGQGASSSAQRFAGAARPRFASGGMPLALNPDLTSALEDKRHEIRTLEEGRQKEIEAVNAQLVQAQVTLTPMHPTVIALQQKLDAISQPSAELRQLKNDERALMAQLVPISAPPSSVPAAFNFAQPSPSASASGSAASPPEAVPSSINDDGTVQLARSKLDSSIRSYEDLLGRIDAANIELDITRTAFKYRFTVVSPAEVPSAPKRPLGKIIAVGSLFAAAILGLLVSVAADMMAGRVLETWQVRRRLKLDVLGEFDLPL